MDYAQARLYIIMREDLWDMNPGKGIAQAAHAQADFDAYIEDTCGPHYRQDDVLWSAVQAWRENRNFGTTLVLNATIQEMHEISYNTKHNCMTTDPTYPYRNYYGKVFVRSEITCMWAFVWLDAEIEYMKQFKLHQ
jgi:peptidyl-tRNA hydrolase